MALLVPALEDVLRVVVSATAIYVLLITWSRLVGPRSFSRMTASDMGVTVALGAIVGGTSTGGTPLWGGALGLSLLFCIRGVVARLRRYGLDRLVDNCPVLVMAGARIVDERLSDAKVTRDDLYEALRTAGITRFDQVWPSWSNATVTSASCARATAMTSRSSPPSPAATTCVSSVSAAQCRGGPRTAPAPA